MRAAMGKERFLISTCPSCGSPAIRKVKGEWTGRYKGMSYTVGALEYYACPNCQEKVYPPEAMRRIQEASPAYSRPRRVRRASGPRA
jgi:YgiT-type zinc finger domain-containing protein